MIRDNFLNINKIIKDPDILRVFRAVENYGGVMRFVGGCVRDAIAGIEVKDLDLATDLSPDEMEEACSEAGLKTIPIGIKFGTIGVVVNGEVLEVTSLRKDVKTDGRRAVVEFTDNWEVDASRRDLTINAVYADEKGNVFDYYNGIEDLEKGIVRFIGKPEKRIREDYLRILRFFRFYSIFSKGKIDEDALKACIKNRDGMKTLSKERVRDEVGKIMLTPNAVKVMKIMFENGILKNFLPKENSLDRLDFLLNWFDDVRIPNADLRRIFIIINPDRKMVEKVAAAMKFSNKKKDHMLAIVRMNVSLDEILDEANLDKLIYLYGKDVVVDKLIITSALENKMVEDIWRRISQIQDRIVPIFPVKGKDIMILGAKDKQIGEVLNAIEKMWIDSHFHMTRDELLEEAKGLIG